MARVLLLSALTLALILQQSGALLNSGSNLAPYAGSNGPQSSWHMLQDATLAVADAAEESTARPPDALVGASDVDAHYPHRLGVVGQSVSTRGAASVGARDAANSDAALVAARITAVVDATHVVVARSKRASHDLYEGVHGCAFSAEHAIKAAVAAVGKRDALQEDVNALVSHQDVTGVRVPFAKKRVRNADVASAVVIGAVDPVAVKRVAVANASSAVAASSVAHPPVLRARVRTLVFNAAAAGVRARCANRRARNADAVSAVVIGAASQAATVAYARNRAVANVSRVVVASCALPLHSRSESAIGCASKVAPASKSAAAAAAGRSAIQANVCARASLRAVVDSNEQFASRHACVAARAASSAARAAAAVALAPSGSRVAKTSACALAVAVVLIVLPGVSRSACTAEAAISVAADAASEAGAGPRAPAHLSVSTRAALPCTSHLPKGLPLQAHGGRRRCLLLLPIARITLLQEPYMQTDLQMRHI
eukprot:IDg5839t1